MAIPDTGPCKNWSPDPACYERPANVSDETEAFALQVATEVLWNRTGRQYGLCSFKLRPCRKDCLPPQPWIPEIGGQVWRWPFPALIGGAWFNLSCSSCRDECSCTRLSSITLPYPVAQVTEVKIDGVVLNPDLYRVDEWRYLIRLGGPEWPLCNDLTLEDTQPGTWSVTADYGTMVPSLGSLAVAELATEIMKACAKDKGCQLSPRVQQVVRQGVTKTFVNAQFDEGLIGLYFCDLFIETVNPSRSAPAAIYDIDGSQPRRVGT